MTYSIYEINNPVEILKRARKLMDDREFIKGSRVEYRDGAAVGHCAIGFVEEVATKEEKSEGCFAFMPCSPYRKALEMLANELDGRSPRSGFDTFNNMKWDKNSDPMTRLAGYNNDPATTRLKLKRLFTSAIRRGAK